MTGDTDATDRLVLYADYVCPFCYLGTRSLERYRETRDDPLEIEWRPFDLRRGKRNPDGSIDHEVDDGKDEAYFEQARRNVERLQDRYDAEMAQVLALEVDSLPAQQASWYVSRAYPDRWSAFDEGVYGALWRECRDIGDLEVLTDVADEVGLPTDEIRSAVDDETLREELEERFDAARRRGVGGVPTFVVDGRAASGAVSPARIAQLVEETDGATERRPQ